MGVLEIFAFPRSLTRVWRRHASQGMRVPAARVAPRSGVVQGAGLEEELKARLCQA
jgi:hypothetical protein